MRIWLWNNAKFLISRGRQTMGLFILFTYHSIKTHSWLHLNTLQMFPGSDSAESQAGSVGFPVTELPLNSVSSVITHCSNPQWILHLHSSSVITNMYFKRSKLWRKMWFQVFGLEIHKFSHISTKNNPSIVIFFHHEKIGTLILLTSAFWDYRTSCVTTWGVLS